MNDSESPLPRLESPLNDRRLRFLPNQKRFLPNQQGNSDRQRPFLDNQRLFLALHASFPAKQGPFQENHEPSLVRSWPTSGNQGFQPLPHAPVGAETSTTRQRVVLPDKPLAGASCEFAVTTPPTWKHWPALAGSRTRRRVPDLHRLVMACRRQPFPVRAKRHAIDQAGVPF